MEGQDVNSLDVCPTRLQIWRSVPLQPVRPIHARGTRQSGPDWLVFGRQSPRKIEHWLIVHSGQAPVRENSGLMAFRIRQQERSTFSRSESLRRSPKKPVRVQRRIDAPFLRRGEYAHANALCASGLAAADGQTAFASRPACGDTPESSRWPSSQRNGRPVPHLPRVRIVTVDALELAAGKPGDNTDARPVHCSEPVVNECTKPRGTTRFDRAPKIRLRDGVPEASPQFVRARGGAARHWLAFPRSSSYCGVSWIVYGNPRPSDGRGLG